MEKKILVVDNDPLILEFMAGILEREGHEVVTAEDAFSVLNMLASFTPDIMFIDLIMPRIGGDNLCRIVRNMQHLNACYLVIISAAIVEQELDYAKIGADAYVVKGSYRKMEDNILAIVNDLDPYPRGNEQKRIIGVDDVHARQMTKELLLQNRHLNFMLDSMSEGILEVYSERIVYANSAAVSLSGLAQEELLGSYPPDLFEKSERQRIEMLLKSGADTPYEIGQDMPVKINGNLVTMKNYTLKEEESSAIILIVDVSEQKRAEEEKRKLEVQLQQAYKMEAVGTLAGGIAHDFNNILGIILGNTELAMVDIPDWNSVRRSLSRAKDACLRARDVVKQILAFSRQTAHELKPIQIGPVISESLRLIRSTMPTTIEIRQDLPGEIVVIMGDSTQINQVLLNLCTNASHAMREKGGILNVSLECIHLEDSDISTLPDLTAGNYVKFTVGDTGQGIAPDQIHRIFDPYFTTKDVGEGSGMGLAVAHGIIANHGGAITVSSEVGKGTVFEVLFPIVEAEPESEMVSEEPIARGNEHILFVDDEPSMVEIYRSMLERLGYEVSVRTSGVEALEAFKAQPDKYDLIITDQTMPHVTGQMLAREIMAIRPGIPVILCTGYSDLINENKAKEMGIRAFVMKPIAMGEIAKTIRDVLD